ncbi:hypothetical protein MT325_M838L [Paramecium bursaria chlorella virus MT325]|uniref:Uncharacterized protein M838L n=1 Tax=Paramecium bursaria Chlorella virus MT325 TaxID=346932 RepID=A7IVL8_PBCVM|nr:hypothetical protein MT325_M838L [Paramecium bursaria chlorella virus MT325]
MLRSRMQPRCSNGVFADSARMSAPCSKRKRTISKCPTILMCDPSFMMASVGHSTLSSSQNEAISSSLSNALKLTFTLSTRVIVLFEAESKAMQVPNHLASLIGNGTEDATSLGTTSCGDIIHYM